MLVEISQMWSCFIKGESEVNEQIVAMARNE